MELNWVPELEELYNSMPDDLKQYYTYTKGVGFHAEILKIGKNGDDEYWDIPGRFFWGNPGFEQIVIGAEEEDGGCVLMG